MANKKRFKSYIPLFLSLLGGLILFFLVDDFVVTVIVLPLLRVFWFLSLVVQSIPQDIIWVGFILVMVIITFIRLRKEKKPRAPARQSPVRYSSTVERWARLLEFAQDSRYSKWRLAQQLKRLTQRLHPSNQDEITRDLSEMGLPPEIKAYFEAPQPSGYAFRGRFNPARKESETELSLDPEIVIQYLEKKLYE